MSMVKYKFYWKMICFLALVIGLIIGFVFGVIS